MSDELKKKKTNAKINWGWDAPENRNGKASRTVKSKSKKYAKQIGVWGVLAVIICCVIGIGLGAFSTYLLSKDDCFLINGVDEITMSLGEYYEDEGVKAISFGRDISNSVTIDTNLKFDNERGYYAETNGTYYMIYKFDDLKYGKVFTVERIRLITFVESAEDEDRTQEIIGGSN